MRMRVGVLVFAAVVSGCAMRAEKDPSKVDYGPSLVRPLEVPPDLVKPVDAAGDPAGTASASGLNARAPDANPLGVLPQFHDFSIERSGDARWLRTREPPEKLWQPLRDFVLSQGLPIAAEDAKLGLIETEWVNNRSERDPDFLQKYLGKVVPGLFSSGMRDRYRIRLDRASDGGAEIHIAHRGLEEVIAEQGTGVQVTRTRWQRRPSDSELEAEMLRRLLLQLGAPEQAAQAALQKQRVPDRATLVRDANEASLRLNDKLDDAWQRVGAALDRLGYVVRTRDRAQALYQVRYTDPAAAADDNAFWQKVIGDNQAPAQTVDYQIALRADESATTLRLLDKKGNAVAADTATPILEQLRQQLK